MRSHVYCRRMVTRSTHPTGEETQKKAAPLQLSSSMTIADIVAIFPGAEKILATWGLHCVGCGGMAFETLDAGVRTHGYSDADVEEIMNDLNTAFAEAPARPESLTVTQSAAEGFWEIAKQEEKTDHVLVVAIDGSGGFCMEFNKEIPADTHEFTNTAVPDLRIFASTLTLRRIGGATIDARDGRFKLDLPEADKVGCACANGGSCACKR